jgi:predicted tellurium resistance membrane protein TerC
VAITIDILTNGNAYVVAFTPRIGSDVVLDTIDVMESIDKVYTIVAIHLGPDVMLVLLCNVINFFAVGLVSKTFISYIVSNRKILLFPLFIG